MAKDMMGKNALMIRLSRRSGSDRKFVFKRDTSNSFADNTVGELTLYEIQYVKPESYFIFLC